MLFDFTSLLYKLVSSVLARNGEMKMQLKRIYFQQVSFHQFYYEYWLTWLLLAAVIWS